MSLRSGMDRRLQGLAEPDDAVALRQRHRVVGPVARDRLVAGEDVAHDPHVLARAGERLGERLAVPAFDDLRARDTQPQDHPPAAEVVHRHRGHRRRRRPAGRHLHDRGAQAHVSRRRTPPRQRRQRVRAVGLRGPYRVEAQLVRSRDRLDRARPAGPRPSSRCSARASVQCSWRGPYPRAPCGPPALSCPADRRCTARGPCPHATAAPSRRGGSARPTCGRRSPRRPARVAARPTRGRGPQSSARARRCRARRSRRAPAPRPARACAWL